MICAYQVYHHLLKSVFPSIFDQCCRSEMNATCSKSTIASTGLWWSSNCWSTSFQFWRQWQLWTSLTLGKLINNVCAFLVNMYKMNYFMIHSVCVVCLLVHLLLSLGNTWLQPLDSKASSFGSWKTKSGSRTTWGSHTIDAITGTPSRVMRVRCCSSLNRSQHS